MPFEFLIYLIYISRYEDKSDTVSRYGGNFEFPAKQDFFFENESILSSRKYETWTFADYFF